MTDYTITDGVTGPRGQGLIILAWSALNVAQAADSLGTFRYLHGWMSNASNSAGLAEVGRSAVYAPRAGTLRDFFADIGPTFGPVTFEVVVNGTPTGVLLVVPSNSTASNLIGTVAIAKGDRIAVRASYSSGTPDSSITAPRFYCAFL